MANSGTITVSKRILPHSLVYLQLSSCHLWHYVIHNTNGMSKRKTSPNKRVKVIKFHLLNSSSFSNLGCRWRLEICGHLHASAVLPCRSSLLHLLDRRVCRTGSDLYLSSYRLRYDNISTVK